MVASTPISSQEVNSVVVHDDYIEVIWDGAQNADKIRKSNIEAFEGAEQLKSKNRPIRLLLLIRNHPLRPNVAAFHEVLKAFRAIKFERVVISGTVSPMLMSLVATTTNSLSNEIEISYVADPDAALLWLRSNSK